MHLIQGNAFVWNDHSGQWLVRNSEIIPLSTGKKSLTLRKQLMPHLTSTRLWKHASSIVHSLSYEEIITLVFHGAMGE